MGLLRCGRCGISYSPGWPAEIGLCGTCREPPRACTRCGQPTKARTEKFGLCWDCKSRENRILRIKPAWKKTYDPRIRIGRVRAPDKLIKSGR